MRGVHPMERENADLKARVHELESQVQWLDEVNRDLADEAAELRTALVEAERLIVELSLS
jgi:cell division protein FtsB